MASVAKEEAHDLLILCDATYSMCDYIESLRTSLPQIISISTLTGCFERIGLLAYRDYCDRELLDWSGWLLTDALSGEPQVDLLSKARKLQPIGGGDLPEATKTGLARAYELMNEDATTIMLLYTDAPPHTRANGDLTDRDSYLSNELKALSNEKSYGGCGKRFKDWTDAANFLAQGQKKVQVFSILQHGMPWNHAGYYTYLSTITGGATLQLTDRKAASISKTTVEVLLSWMGAEKSGASDSDIPATVNQYDSVDGIKTLASEDDSDANAFFDSIGRGVPKAIQGRCQHRNVVKISCSSNVLKAILPRKSTAMDFTQRYKRDEKYKKLVVLHLMKIIAEDVTAITINPIFGSLWRVVCNDRENDKRDALLTTFGSEVDKIRDPIEKERMKAWLEESYDYTAEVLEAIDSVPVDQRYPCVCLDPTLTFTHESDIDEDISETNKPITFFTRDELLEIGRSCDYKILRRLGRVLTRLTYIKSADEVPAHIAASEDAQLIPMSLASPRNGRRFWKILLHIVVPGTMLSARPAAVLAALAMRLGVEPLIPAAERELLLWCNRWNNLEVPETWNMGCLGLLLDADESYRKRHTGADEVDVNVSDEEIGKFSRILNAEDRELFKLLVSYKMLELNLGTTLTAKIGWTPSKSIVSIGPVVICKDCSFPRSVTIMGEDGKCGLCLWNQYKKPDDKGVDTQNMPQCSKDDNETTPATWVECNLRTCRAQYVVYEPQSLNVKPKCYYCRINKKAPTLECIKCLNRVIWPEDYRTASIQDKFECYACASDCKTTVELETTAALLSTENGTAWLLRNNKNKIPEPFNHRSLFHTISSAKPEGFVSKVSLLPDSAKSDLVLHSKLIRNSSDLVAQLQSWIVRRRTEAGQCSICFSTFKKANILPACGRSGCNQRICQGCLKDWYGLNAAGRIINTTACLCPFCRRPPAAKTLAKHGMGIHAVADLANAFSESGEWIYAWCTRCNHAKRYLERVCAAGAPLEITNWACEDCSKRNPAGAKECPSCGTMTEKTSGCDHITCNCGTHWCYYCGEEKTLDDIYDHMNEAHGGFYGGGNADDEVENEYDSDY